MYYCKSKYRMEGRYAQNNVDANALARAGVLKVERVKIHVWMKGDSKMPFQVFYGLN